jgi:hypothetical protein
VRIGGDGGGVEILFNSDRSTDRLWAITLERYMGLVGEVAHDETRWIDLDGPRLRRRHRPSDLPA